MRLASTVDDSAVYTIPIMFIVFHLGEPVGTGSNFSDSTLYRQVDELNKAYRGGSQTYPSPNTRIKFVLASKTPDCQSTAILRADASQVPYYAERGLILFSSIQPIDDFSSRIPTIYKTVNAMDGVIPIYIYHKVEGLYGFATAGGSVVMSGEAIKYQDVNWPFYVLAHEIGHVLNLKHTFEGGDATNCPPNNNPEMDGDGVADTDPHKQNEPNSCGTDPVADINSCTGRPFGRIGLNMMSYGCRRNQFTPGQITRMRTFLRDNLPLLVHSIFTQPINPQELVNPTACKPVLNQPSSNQSLGGINKVEFANLSKTSGSFPNAIFYDYSCIYSAQVTSGQTYPLTITGYGTFGRAYIDYNGDGVFNEETELVMNFQSSDASNQFTATQSITIPATAQLNQRLRLRVMFDLGSTPPTACRLPGDAVKGSGEVEDYGLMIVAPTCQTIQAGLWSDPSIWSCGHVPTLSEVVHLYHTVTIPEAFHAYAKHVSYHVSAPMKIENQATLRLGN
jgi:hypothetical protein